jgi:hypothetical protein
MNIKNILLDPEDEHLRQFLRLKTKDGYTQVVNTKGQVLARLLLNLVDIAAKADHMNGNSLDCRKDNLRVATNSQNGHNRKCHTKKDNMPAGVEKLAENRFRARIKHNHIIYKSSTVLTVEEAEGWYIKKSIELFGEYARHLHR